MKSGMEEKPIPLSPRQHEIFMGAWDAKVTASRHTHTPLPPSKDTVEPLSDILSKDPMTGVLNRRKFDKDLPMFIKENNVAFLIFDANKMKAVNDRFGHTAGDHLLRRIASLLEGSVEASDRIYRIGGDEFALLLEHITRKGLDRVVDRIKQEFTSSESLSKPSISGGAVYLDEQTDPGLRGNVFTCADAAMHRAKLSLKIRREESSVHAPSEIFLYDPVRDGSPDTLRQLAFRAENHVAGE